MASAICVRNTERGTVLYDSDSESGQAQQYEVNECEQLCRKQFKIISTKHCL